MEPLITQNIFLRHCRISIYRAWPSVHFVGNLLRCLGGSTSLKCGTKDELFWEKNVKCNTYLSRPFVLISSPKFHFKFICLSGETKTIDDPSNHVCFETYNAQKYNLFKCEKRGRYLTIQSVADDVELSLCEMAVHKRPIGECKSIVTSRQNVPVCTKILLQG